MHKGYDIRCLLEGCMKLWRDEQYDVLLQEAARCDQSLCNSHQRPSSRDSKEHLIKVFTRLMLESNVHAAVRWLTEHSGSGVLKPSDTATIGGTSMTVLEVLGLKNPDPCTPPDWVLPSMAFEDSEITGSHILSIAHTVSYRVALVLVCVMLHIGEMYCLGMVPLVLICVILLQDCVVISAIPLFPGIVLQL